MAQDSVTVTLDGEVVDRLPAERVVLDYPGLTARAEACMGVTSDGDVWAAVGFNTGLRGAHGHFNPERLFRSSDGGRTWDSQPMAPTGSARMCGFAVLADDTFLLTVGPDHDAERRDELRVFASSDRGRTWDGPSVIAAAPHERIAGSFECIAQTRTGVVLLPAARHSGFELDGPKEHLVFPSHDGGRTWGEPYTTFDDVYEPHVLQLQSGRLLGAFRYQRGWRPDDPPEIVETMAAGPNTPVAGIPGSGATAFKHVFVGDSHDDGRTWQDLRPLTTGQGRPVVSYGECHGQLAQASDGRVVMVHDRRYPYEAGETRAKISDDDGLTWRPETYHLASGHGYPACVALDDGTLVTVTGATPFDANANVLTDWRAEAIVWRLP